MDTNGLHSDVRALLERPCWRQIGPALLQVAAYAERVMKTSSPQHDRWEETGSIDSTTVSSGVDALDCVSPTSIHLLHLVLNQIDLLLLSTPAGDRRSGAMDVYEGSAAQYPALGMTPPSTALGSHGWGYSNRGANGYPYSCQVVPDAYGTANTFPYPAPYPSPALLHGANGQDLSHINTSLHPNPTSHRTRSGTVSHSHAPTHHRAPPSQQDVRRAQPSQGPEGLTPNLPSSPPSSHTQSSLSAAKLSAEDQLQVEKEQALYATFKKRDSPVRFFRIGRVFSTLWTEPLAEGNVSMVTRTSFKGNHGESVHSKVRRFIVVREGRGYCNVLPITSYGNRGVKRGAVKHEHSIIYTGLTSPQPMPSELPRDGELSMLESSIRIVPDDPTDKLTPSSRIHYGKMQTIEHYVKVRSFGVAHKDSIGALLGQAGRLHQHVSPISPTSSSMLGFSHAVAGNS